MQDGPPPPGHALQGEQRSQARAHTHGKQKGYAESVLCGGGATRLQRIYAPAVARRAAAAATSQSARPGHDARQQEHFQQTGKCVREDGINDTKGWARARFHRPTHQGLTPSPGQLTLKLGKAPVGS
eukprot:1160757-Pelagomonas_calceolata.AAC.4